jgi:hypothetical protein
MVNLSVASRETRPVVMGANGMVASSHPPCFHGRLQCAAKHIQHRIAVV